MATMKSRRSGVALIVVLGLVAILMIVSVTFTIHMRVERAGAANLRYAAIARQVVKGGLAASLMAIDRQAGDSAVPEWYDPNDVTSLTYRPFPKSDKVKGYLWRDTFVSFDTNDTDNVSVNKNALTKNKEVSGDLNAQVFSEEVERYFPAGLAYRGYATAYNPLYANESGFSEKWRPIIQPQWQPVFADVNNDNVMGRYAFFALDTTCLLDASCLTNSTNARWMGRHPGEIDMSLPNQTQGFLSWTKEKGKDKEGGVRNAGNFTQGNYESGTYETLAEFESLVNNPVEVIKDNPYFNTLSYDPGPTNDLIYIGGSAADIRSHKREIIEAFYDCGLTAGKAYGSKDCEQARWAYLGLVDYVDDDFAMEPDDQIEPWERPVTERMPLLSGFIGKLSIEARQTCTKEADAPGYDYSAPVEVKISADVKVPFVFPFIVEDFEAKDSEGLELEGKAGLVVVSKAGAADNEAKKLSIAPKEAEECVVNSIKLDNGQWLNVKGAKENLSVADQLKLEGVRAELRVAGATYRNGELQHCFPVKKGYYNDFEEDETETGMYVKFIPKDEGVKFDEDAAGGTPSEPDKNGKVTWVRTWSTNVIVWAEIVDPRFANRELSRKGDFDEEVMFTVCKVSHGGAEDDSPHAITLSKLRKQVTAFSDFDDAEKLMAMAADKAFGKDTKSDYGEYFKNNWNGNGTVVGTSPFVSYLLTHPKAVEAFFDMPMDGIQKGAENGNTDKAWAKQRMYVKNAPLESVGELGYLPVGIWQTIRLYDYCDGLGTPDPGKTVDKLSEFSKLPKNKNVPNKDPYGGYFHPVLDYFTVVPDTEMVQGRVNLNALDKNILAVAFHNMPVQTEFGNAGQPERIDRTKSGEKPSPQDLPSFKWLAEAIVAYREDAGRGFRALSELGYLFGVGDEEFPLLYGTANDDLSYPSLAVQKAVNLSGNSSPWGEWEREAVIRNSCGLFTMRGQTFIVVVRGESYSAPYGRKKSMKGGTSNASKTAIAQVWRDSIPDGNGNHPMYVQFFKIIDD